MKHIVLIKLLLNHVPVITYHIRFSLSKMLFLEVMTKFAVISKFNTTIFTI